MSESEAQQSRIDAIVGGVRESSFREQRERYCQYLRTALQLPVRVTGIEDFQWEEFYVFGPGDPKEYKRLCRKMPSYRDTYELLAIESDVASEWMLLPHEDLAARIRRISDDKQFILGLSELKACEQNSAAHQLLGDFYRWLAMNR